MSFKGFIPLEIRGRRPLLYFWQGFPAGFTLAEILVSIILTGLIILAATSIDITSRRFLGIANRRSEVQNEAKISMEHIVKYVQLGSGFTIHDSGARIRIQVDGNYDGQYKTTDYPLDKEIEYTYNSSNHTIVYDPDVNISSTGDEEVLADSIVDGTGFSDAGCPPNQIKVTIEILHDPSQSQSPENPKTTLISSIVLRAMSCN